MVRILLFNLIYGLVCVFALVRGGAPERIAALVLAADFELSFWLVTPMGHRFHGVEWHMFMVDLLAFAALLVLSWFSARFWPMWTAAVQGCVALSHLAGLVPEIVPWAYGTVVAGWAYLLLAMLGAGTWRHLRRLRRYGRDPAWFWELPEAYRSGARADDVASNLFRPGPT